MIILLYTLAVLFCFLLIFGGIIYLALNMCWDWTPEGELLLWYDSYNGGGMRKTRKYIILYKKK
jgi:hypothetical protein